MWSIEIWYNFLKKKSNNMLNWTLWRPQKTGLNGISIYFIVNKLLILGNDGSSRLNKTQDVSTNLIVYFVLTYYWLMSTTYGLRMRFLWMFYFVHMNEQFVSYGCHMLLYTYYGIRSYTSYIMLLFFTLAYYWLYMLLGEYPSCAALLCRL